MKHRGFIAIIFVIGCATGGVTSQLVIPTARAGTTPTHWEHFCGRVGTGSLTTHLNAAGAEGWELVSIAPARQETSFGNTTVAEITFCAKRAAP